MSVNETQTFLSLLTNPALTALLGASLSGIGVQWIATHGQNQQKDKILKVDESTALRIELRAEVDKLRKQLDEKEITLEKWREKYYDLVQKYNEALNRAQIAEADLEEARNELERLKPPNGQH